MVIWDVEFSREGYKIKKVLGQKSILSNKEWTKKLNHFNFSSFFGDFCLKVFGIKPNAE